MHQTKINKVHEILKSRRTAVSKDYLLERLAPCSPSTLKRIFRVLRDEYNAPLEYFPEFKGYQYTDESFELNLPGIYHSPDTILALISSQKMLEQMQLDLLDTHLKNLKEELANYLKRKKIQSNQLHRIRILPINARISNTLHFQQIASALLQRYLLTITYHARGDDLTTTRVISPQRLAHYKDNWYLDAWCHLRNQMRTFALDRIRKLETSIDQCMDIPEHTLDKYLASSYGIFAGDALNKAILVFSQTRARWVADETWHPQQVGQWLPNGQYKLEIPYSDQRELLMDIMRHLPEVEVIYPLELKQTLIQHLEQSLKQHEINKK